MRKLTLTLCFLCLLWSGQALAKNPNCLAAATEKRLAGAARTSFLNKCERDATAVCEAAAVEKKLHGAAKTSFTKKCKKDSVGEAEGV